MCLDFQPRLFGISVEGFWILRIEHNVPLALRAGAVHAAQEGGGKYLLSTLHSDGLVFV